MSEAEELRSHLSWELMQMGVNDAYFEDAALDETTFYATMDRAIQLVRGQINSWTDLKPPEV